jgi:malate dehydrogenase (oxaloacetate-decarboxylating)
MIMAGYSGGPVLRGVLDDPFRNRGVAFTHAEREALGLTGRLPAAVLSLEDQARANWLQYAHIADYLPL